MAHGDLLRGLADSEAVIIEDRISLANRKVNEAVRGLVDLRVPVSKIK
jgi:hypothetical protein